MATIGQPLPAAGRALGSEMRTWWLEAWIFASGSAPHYSSHLGKASNLSEPPFSVLQNRDSPTLTSWRLNDVMNVRDLRHAQRIVGAQ